MRIEENWHDAGVFFAKLHMKSNEYAEKKDISRCFVLKNCFDKNEATTIILKKFPNSIKIVHIDFIETCHMLKDS